MGHERVAAFRKGHTVSDHDRNVRRRMFKENLQWRPRYKAVLMAEAFQTEAGMFEGACVKECDTNSMDGEVRKTYRSSKGATAGMVVERVNDWGLVKKESGPDG